MATEQGRVAILGLGLMGASLGLALRTHAPARHSIAGYDAAPGVAARARALGAVDTPCQAVAEAVAGANLVVLAAPVLALRELLAAIAPHLAAGAVVTDLGSVKAAVVAWAEELLPDASRFVGGHPMTGRECSGVAAADPTLYRGHTWCLTPTARTAPLALRRVQAMARRVGARPRVLDATRHDAAVAAISHLPLLAAAALALTASADPDWPEARRLAAGGFHDTTRVASGDPRMARDICLTNTQPVLACLDRYLATLQALRARVAAGDASIETCFAQAKRARDAWLAERDAPSTHPPG
ncbi:MAG: prephenate dehydrogenase/arogenate dehydrogenase family protein [Ktedonobacterales bacterium]|nr:prephenate dehydrogenase/arogenate dehydrogenase family protein [Ktedonobacterales bacterium]